MKILKNLRSEKLYIAVLVLHFLYTLHILIHCYQGVCVGVCVGGNVFVIVLFVMRVGVD